MERGGWAGEMLRDQVTLEEGGGVYSVCAWPFSYDHRPSHPYYAGTEDVGF